jgi:hypothetical protein
MQAFLRVVFVVFLAGGAFAQQPVRLSWQEFEKDPRRVQSLRNAIATMKARNSADPSTAEYRLSWEYWANMHGYFGPEAKSGRVAQYREDQKLTDPSEDAAFAGVVDTTPPNDTARKVWDQCEHASDWFLPWHRLFLFYFEQILQDAANDPTLRLPYWDYTDSAQLAMPEAYRSPTYVNVRGEVVANPLYEPRREAVWEGGGTGLAEVETNVDQTFDIDHLLIVDDEPGFTGTLERAPHATVHCALKECFRTVMGSVPYSANDPVFWVHHCNIDRLWQCWQSISGHEDPAGTWRDKTYTLVDREGNLVTKQVSSLYDGSLIDYVYERPSNCARTAAPVADKSAETTTSRTARAALKKPVRIGGSGGFTIANARTSARITLPATASLAHPRQFALRANAALPVAADLLLRGVHFQRHPGTSIRVFLEHPTDSARRTHVGTLSFFSAPHHGHGNDDWRFDATLALRALRLEGTGTFDVKVAFEATTDFDPAAAGLTIDAIELRVRRDL